MTAANLSSLGSWGSNELFLLKKFIHMGFFFSLFFCFSSCLLLQLIFNICCEVFRGNFLHENNQFVCCFFLYSSKSLIYCEIFRGYLFFRENNKCFLLHTYMLQYFLTGLSSVEIYYLFFSYTLVCGD